MTVTVRFVGSGDSFGSGGRFQTCILVDGPGIGILTHMSQEMLAHVDEVLQA